MEPGREGSPPQPILVYPGNQPTETEPVEAQAHDVPTLDDDGLPPPVKAASTPNSPRQAQGSGATACSFRVD